MTPSPVRTRKQEPHVEVQNPAHGSCAKDTTPQPSGFNPSPSSHAPNMPAPRPHPEARGTGEASSTSEADFGFPTKMPDNEVSSCCLLQSPRHPPGTVGCSQNHLLVELAAEPQGRSGRPYVPGEKIEAEETEGDSGYIASEWQFRTMPPFGQRTPSVVTLRQWLLQSPLQGLRCYSHRAVGHYDGCEVGRVHAPPRVTLGNP